jgi:hypothetical protein
MRLSANANDCRIVGLSFTIKTRCFTTTPSHSLRQKPRDQTTEATSSQGQSPLDRSLFWF